MQFPRGWITRDSGDRIKLNFVNSGILKGEWYTEVPVGSKAFQKRGKWRNNLAYIKEIAYSSAKRIDLVCIPSENNVFHPRIDSRHLDQLNFNGKRVWLIETKKKLDYCALGQILVYKHLFLEDWDAIVEGIGIAFEEGDKTIEEVCAEVGVKTWYVPPADLVSKRLNALREKLGINDDELDLIDLQILEYIYREGPVTTQDLENRFGSIYSRGQIMYTLGKLKDKKLIRWSHYAWEFNFRKILEDKLIK